MNNPVTNDKRLSQLIGELETLWSGQADAIIHILVDMPATIRDKVTPHVGELLKGGEIPAALHLSGEEKDQLIKLVNAIKTHNGGSKKIWAEIIPHLKQHELSLMNSEQGMTAFKILLEHEQRAAITPESVRNVKALADEALKLRYGRTLDEGFRVIESSILPSQTASTVKTIEKNIEKNGGETGLIVGGIIAAAIGIGAAVSMNKPREKKRPPAQAALLQQIPPSQGQQIV